LLSHAQPVKYPPTPSTLLANEDFPDIRNKPSHWKKNGEILSDFEDSSYPLIGLGKIYIVIILNITTQGGLVEYTFKIQRIRSCKTIQILPCCQKFPRD
jgi:hypothetical protein